MKNRTKAKPEIVDMKKFAGLCIVTTVGYGERRAMLLREQGLALLKAKNGWAKNYVFYHALQCLEPDLRPWKIDVASSIVTPMLKGEKAEGVADRLTKGLEKIRRKKNVLFYFSGARIPNSETFPGLVNLRYTFGRVRNLPGGLRVPIEFKVKFGTPYFRLFLPRDEAGNFVNLGGQKLCLQRLQVLPNLKDILADVIVCKPYLLNNPSPVNRRGMKISCVINGASTAMMNGAAENMVMLILITRALLKNQGLKTGKDEPTVFSSDRVHSDFVKFRYSRKLHPGDFRIVCSDMRVDCRYNHGNKGKITLTMS